MLELIGISILFLLGRMFKQQAKAIKDCREILKQSAGFVVRVDVDPDPDPVNQEEANENVVGLDAYRDNRRVQLHSRDRTG